MDQKIFIQINDDILKCKKVVASCKNLDHLKGSKKFLHLIKLKILNKVIKNKLENYFSKEYLLLKNQTFEIDIFIKYLEKKFSKKPIKKQPKKT